MVLTFFLGTALSLLCVVAIFAAGSWGISWINAEVAKSALDLAKAALWPAAVVAIAFRYENEIRGFVDRVTEVSGLGGTIKADTVSKQKNSPTVESLDKIETKTLPEENPSSSKHEESLPLISTEPAVFNGEAPRPAIAELETELRQEYNRKLIQQNVSEAQARDIILRELTFARLEKYFLQFTLLYLEVRLNFCGLCERTAEKFQFISPQKLSIARSMHILKFMDPIILMIG